MMRIVSMLQTPLMRSACSSDYFVLEHTNTLRWCSGSSPAKLLFHRETCYCADWWGNQECCGRPALCMYKKNFRSSLDRWGILQKSASDFAYKNDSLSNKVIPKSSQRSLEVLVLTQIHRLQQLTVWSLLLRTNTLSEIPQDDLKDVFSARTQCL